MNRIHRAALAAALVAGLAAPAAAQTFNVTQADIQRLQDNVYLAERDVTQLRSRDSSRASQLQSELDDLRDEVVYLKVKLRKEGSLGRTEYAEVRDHIEDVRSRARGDSSGSSTSSSSSSSGLGSAPRPAAAPAPTPAPAPAATPAPAPTTQAQTSSRPAPARGTAEIPSGTEMDVRLSNNLNSGISKPEDRFEGTTLVDLTVDGRVLVPAGSILRGVVSSVDPATRTNRTGKMTVSFDQITVNNRSYPIRGTVTQAIQSEGIKGEAGKIGVGAGAGAIIGGILGGFKGALAGILIGGGGTIAATEGKEVDLPQGAVLRVRIDSPVQIQTAR